MSSFERDGDDDRRYFSVVVVPDSGTAQLMVAMQPEVDLSTVEVQEVVVVTDRDRRFRSSSIARGNHGSCYFDDDEEEANADMHTRGEDEIVEYDYGSSEAVAAEIEVVDGRSSLEGLLGAKKARRGRFKRRRGRFAKKSPPTKMIRTATMNRKRIVESSPQFGESDSDTVGEAGYGGSLLKRRKRDFAHRHVFYISHPWYIFLAQLSLCRIWLNSNPHTDSIIPSISQYLSSMFKPLL